MERRKEAAYRLPDELKRYSSARVFNDSLAKEFKPGDVLGPVIVGENNSLLSKDEVAILARGPKFTIRRVLSKERFIIMLVKAYIKEMMAWMKLTWWI